MDKITQVWNQYVNLRDEIKATDAACFQVLGIVIAATTSILLAGINQHNLIPRFLTFMSVYIITISGYRFLKGKRSSIWRISTYINVFLEPELYVVVQWERNLDKQRKDTNNKNSSLVIDNEWVTITLLNWLTATLIILDVLFLAKFPILNKIVGIVVVLVGNVELTRRSINILKKLYRNGDVQTSYLKSWEKIRASQDKKASND